MNETVNFNLLFNSNGEPLFKKINTGLDGVRKSTRKTTKTFGDCFQGLLSFSLATQALEDLKNSFDSLLEPGIQLNSQLADLSAITGLTGDGLDATSDAARTSAKVFGTDASANML